MAPAFGNSAGGHTFNMVYQYHGQMRDNIAACTQCHAGIENFNINGVQDEIEDLLGQLEDLLLAAGILNPESGRWNPGTYPTNVTGAALNWKFVEEDRSHGIHNYKYAKALLTNSIELLQ